MKMKPITLSSKFQLVLPKELRDQLRLTPGLKFHALAVGDHIELIPVRPLEELCGFLEGIDTDVPRDDDRV